MNDFPVSSAESAAGIGRVVFSQSEVTARYFDTLKRGYTNSANDWIADAERGFEATDVGFQKAWFEFLRNGTVSGEGDSN